MPLVKYDPMTRRYRFGSVLLFRDSMPSSMVAMFDALRTNNWVKNPLIDIELAYSPPENGFYGLDDDSGHHYTVNEILTQLLDAYDIAIVVSVKCTDDKIYSLDQLKTKYPHWFDYAYIYHDRIPTFTNYDLSLTSLVYATVSRFCFMKKTNRKIHVRKRVAIQPTTKQKSKRKINVR